MNFIVKTISLLMILGVIFSVVFFYNRKAIQAETAYYPPYGVKDEFAEGATPLKIASRLKTDIFTELQNHWKKTVKNTKNRYTGLEEKDNKEEQ
ncbi:MAG: hypothetical protein AAF518_10900 [Spirochaetota bacterium]